MKLRDVMTTRVVSVRPEASVQQAAQQMRDLNVGVLPVCDENNRPVGIVTDRDIVLRSVSEGRTPADQVGTIMSSGVISGTPDMDVDEAARLMADNQIRRLPVVENGSLVGIVSLGDLATKAEYQDEAGQALSSISRPSEPRM